MENQTITTPPQIGKQITDNKTENGLLDFLQSLLFALVISVVVYIFVLTPNEVEGSSMQPNYYSGDRLYTNKLSHFLADTDLGRTLGLDYARGDVVVVNKPGLNPLIKRVVGLPGEEIRLEDGHIYINGEKLLEKYISDDIETNPGTFLNEGETIKISEGEYFVMGDNRPVSSDSRFIGLIKKEWIEGKVVARIWPLNKAEITKTGEYELVSSE